MKVRWPFVAFLAAMCAAYLGLRAWRHRHVAATVTAIARTVPSAPVPVPTRCTRATGEPARGVTHVVDARAYHVWGPSAPQQPLPIALVLHGWQSDGQGFQKWFRFEDQTGDAAFVVYPDATSGLWDVLGSKDLDFLEHVLDDVARIYCVDRSRVLVVGFSYGAKMANHLGCKRPDLVAGIAAGAGSWADDTPRCGGGVPVLVTNRTKDDNERVEWGHDAARRWAWVQGCSPTETPSALGEGCTEFSTCRAPGSVTWCEDSWFDPSWPHDWNHTIRENYRAIAWRWFGSLPPR